MGSSLPTPRPEPVPLREPAPAKLNLALHVRRRRADGYHELETLFAFCTEGDRLTGTSEPASAHRLELAITGPFGAGLGREDNLVTRAWAALKPAAPPALVRLTLDKRLPVASGLGGGSADAAAALRLLTALWRLDPAIAQDIAPRLGADVPACLLSMSARGEGVGDKLTPVPTPQLSGRPVLLVNPLEALSTPAVFAAWDGEDRGGLGTDWRAGRNDLEAPATTLVPAIGSILEWLGRQPGCELARMSGSGASCFALFDSEPARDAAAAACPDKWWHLATYLR
ncbi:4-(cytidine 5'-diphospho)-2-C-methyl-D-erythritol kinase [Sphingomicrobium astaxanthinifaciens]|uniref:4-(cytidine 5'-diphospho)-2-C-methyl-D-erythritol kinase n=1 Tax=Sphingomicrobium astaxanthinifaciens TaxID=1227949 RepID=UPI001FCA8241|nr:4-(cytidine 5'-diphospho)-2-C-methyl-D-erythritol kinase [Sphingomicrobium astaxanthinifaciens]MCJ7422353.1 4-(cytidine 5'-diphospho)-2-C-methyl-D-erythritol kinase [Sphingomicrobium astaxanthinifaciens]